jgi:hypothetical protein
MDTWECVYSLHKHHDVTVDLDEKPEGMEVVGAEEEQPPRGVWGTVKSWFSGDKVDRAKLAALGGLSV